MAEFSQCSRQDARGSNPVTAAALLARLFHELMADAKQEQEGYFSVLCQKLSGQVAQDHPCSKSDHKPPRVLAADLGTERLHCLRGHRQTVGVNIALPRYRA